MKPYPLAVVVVPIRIYGATSKWMGTRLLREISAHQEQRGQSDLCSPIPAECPEKESAAEEKKGA